MSRFLITDETVAVQPINPSPDTATWRGSGAISQVPNPQDQNRYSLLTHLRHLLSSDTTLNALGLQGGLSAWLYRDIGSVQELALSTKTSYDAHDSIQLQRQLIQLLDYLDGVNNVAEDVPAGTPVLVNDAAARVGLLQNHAYQNPPAYLYHIGQHLLSLVSCPGTTSEQRELATHIVSEINAIRLLLEQVRSIAKELVKLSPNRLLQPQQKDNLTELVQLTTAVSIGQSQGSPGRNQLQEQLEQLATIQIKG